MLSYATTMDVYAWARLILRHEIVRETHTIRELMKRVETDKRFRLVNPELHAKSVMCLNRMFKALLLRRESFAAPLCELVSQQREPPCAVAPDDSLVFDMPSMPDMIDLQ